MITDREVYEEAQRCLQSDAFKALLERLRTAITMDWESSLLEEAPTREMLYLQLRAVASLAGLISELALELDIDENQKQD